MKCFVYVAPCAWEDLLKVGHSRDPLARLEAFHRRWYETFDPDLAWLVELDRVREAAALELSLRRGLVEHNAPAPLTIRREAAGQGEWFRGASDALVRERERLAAAGHLLHLPARDWLRSALLARADRLHGWTAAMLDADALEAPVDATPVSRAVRDVLDAYAAFGIDLAPMLPPEVARWRGLVG
ncbi:MAG TPA: GIY-YIG nuclease family protein [Xanthomonadaceae bacterium]|nr:GIY-YIG nuclease family protein [Xanthomonadaceae bacterium]